MCECFYVNVDDWCIFFSQAAIQASKLRAKEVGLTHFEWAKVELFVMSQLLVAILMHLLGSNYHGSREEESLS